jgi:hypothetical protein
MITGNGATETTLIGLIGLCSETHLQRASIAYLKAVLG